MGRLFPVKGFDLLLRAFAIARAQVPGWTLHIWGEGPERQELEVLAKHLGLTSCTYLPGLTTQPFEILGGADLFVLPSRAEGFPNALVEAMACGLPVISTDFGGAARDIIRHGVDGLLVPPEDVSALAGALVSLMSDPEARAKLSARAGEVKQRFSSQRVIGMWELALDLARNRRGLSGGNECPT
jgi:glycosyltransferase involved in cell wall biosynthesis